jgi:endoglucanase
MPFTRRAATALLLSAIAIPAIAKSAAVKSTTKVPTRGFALPDWLAATPREPSPSVLAQLRSAGFETIRLPVDPAIVTADFAPKVADVLTTVTAAGFNAILDLHPRGDVDPDQADAAWAILAGVIASTPTDRVYAELLNEPSLDAGPWARLAARLVATIRAKAPDHPLIWGPARVQGIWELADQTPPADANLVAAVHYYTPMGFTHQAENWDDSPLARLHDLPWPTTRTSPPVTALAASLDPADRTFLDGEFGGPWTSAHVDRDFADLAKWSSRHRVPVMLGEFGVLDFAVDTVSRTNWVRAVRKSAEANGAGWVYWEADQGFGFIADRTRTDGVDQPMLEALLA